MDLGRPGRALDDVHDHPAPVVRDHGDGDLVTLVSLAEELHVVGHRGAERVEHHPRRHVAVALVVEPPAVRGQGHPAVAGRRQHVVELLSGVDVADTDGDLVDAALAHGIGHPRPVVRDVPEGHARGVVRAHRVRVDQHAVLAVEPLAHVDHRQVLVRAPPAVEVAPPALVRQADHVALEHRRGPRPQLAAARQGTEHRIGVAVLGVDPGARLGRLLVLEPTVGVGHVDAVQRVDDLPDLGGRGRGHLDSPVLGAGAHQRHGGDNPGDTSRSGHALLPDSRTFSVRTSADSKLNPPPAGSDTPAPRPAPWPRRDRRPR